MCLYTCPECGITVSQQMCSLTPFTLAKMRFVFRLGVKSAAVTSLQVLDRTKGSGRHLINLSEWVSILFNVLHRTRAFPSICIIVSSRNSSD